MIRRRQARLAVIHRKCPEHSVVVRKNRGGPDRAQAVADRDVAAVLPKRINPGVFRVHRLAQERRCPARAHVGRDAQERIDARLVILGDIRRSGKPEPLLHGVHQQHGAAHTVSLFLDQPDQGFENLP